MGQLCSSSRGSAISRLTGIVLLLASTAVHYLGSASPGQGGPRFVWPRLWRSTAGLSVPLSVQNIFNSCSDSVSEHLGVYWCGFLPLRNPEFFMGISTPKPSSGFGSGSCFTAKNLDQLSLPTPHCHKKSHCLFLP